ncbi:MAG: GGDEF domain-containing protein [Thiohalophilus sp.]|uniref:GGDEF domain-containing protein n=1 Tax=Thiohalophilus sp. TaxID=3028392 RepID=UPI0028708490|nr:GGDEF domain-containing protein [Thiohalophilus sp.]MDR9436477.1 GGDEF domain-containing protein [Thiohalophilus sp.]
MALDLQRSLKTLLLPALLLLAVYMLQQPLSDQLMPLGEILARLPYALFITGMAFALLFRHSREFFNLLILLLCVAVLDVAVWSATPHSHSTLIHALLCLLVPVNLVINDLWQERGILNRYGLQRAAAIATQLLLAVWVVHSPPGALVDSLAFTPLPLLAASPIPALAQLVILLCSIVLLIYVFTHPAPLQGTLFIGFISLVLALHQFDTPILSRLYLLLSGLLILLALLFNIRQLAYYDELTRLPSRRSLRQTLMSQGSRYSLAMVDVDHFKKLNDTHGHDVGDQVLRMLAAHLNKVKGGKAFRYGGEEFTLVFPGKLTDETRAILEQLRETIANSPFRVRHKSRPAKRPEKPRPRSDTPDLSISVSIGVADTTTADDPQAIMKRADQALYQAKKKGRNRVVAS